MGFIDGIIFLHKKKLNISISKLFFSYNIKSSVNGQLYTSNIFP